MTDNIQIIVSQPNTPRLKLHNTHQLAIAVAINQLIYNDTNLLVKEAIFMKSLNVTVGTRSYLVTNILVENTSVNFAVEGIDYSVAIEMVKGDPFAKGSGNPSLQLQGTNRTVPDAVRSSSKNQANILAPMPGIVTGVAVAVGDEVTAGAVIATIEAMKMENNVVAIRSGKIAKINVKQGQEVAKGEVLVELI
jgi:glutaconyl-CoA/methylmalonyl-CoA decarboxylase subunit gamma